MQIKIEVSPSFADLADNIGEIDERLNSLDLNDLVPVIVEEVVRVFETEGYGQWPALSPAYKEWKAANYPGQPILRLMDKYFSAATQPGNPNNFIDLDDNRIEYGVDGLDHPRYHEDGTSKTPARPVFGLLEESETFQQVVTEALDQIVIDAIG